jgi:polygalacturonase
MEPRDAIITMELKSANGHWRTGIRIGMPVAGMLWFAGTALAVPAPPVINTNNIVNITSFGAVSSTTLTNTTAIQNAINAAAVGGTTNGAAGGTVEIPPGIYLSGPLTMASSVNFQIDAGAILRMLPYGSYPGSASFIGATNVNDVEISGSGAIDGQGFAWWTAFQANSSLARPIMIRFQGCNRQLIQNVTLSNSPMFHISISSSKGNATVQGVTIQSPPSSANPPAKNTDACDVSGTNVLVQNCNISVGDDDFTCSGGTSGVLIMNNTYGNGHGISIGSYTDSGGVSNITVINCTINGADNGIRIKSDNDRGGLVQNISYCNIGMTNVHFPIQIIGYYNWISTPSSVSPFTAAGTNAAAVTGTTPIYRNITFSNITATSVSGYPVGIIWARTEMPATNIVFNKINVTGDRNFCLYNVSGAQFIDSKITVSTTSNTFALFNAQVIVTNSSPTANRVTFDGLTTNGYGSSFAFYNAQASLKNTNVFDDGPLTIGGSKLTVSNNLTLFPTTILNYILGTNAATVSVISNLTLGGTINITNGVGFTNGTYKLLTYAGNLNGSLPTLAGKPTGLNYIYSLITNTPGQVNLLVQTPPSPVITAGMLSANGEFSFDVTNGPPSNSVYVLAATNLALPLAQWTPVATNQFDGNGQLLFTNAADPAVLQTFYLLELP